MRQTIAVGEIEAAAGRIEGLVRATPLLPAGELSRRLGTKVVLKAENPTMSPIVVDPKQREIRILGKVIGLLRGF